MRHETFEHANGVIGKPNIEEGHILQWQQTKGKTMIYKAGNRKLKIEYDES
jgi:hypothetical protein